jgi:regulator of sigma E protease
LGYVLAALLLLGVLITVHELGHFLAARLSGMAVNEFAIGMGPKLFSRKGKQGTIYSLRAFPLGGFCLFYGEDDEVDDPRAYNRQPLYKRFLSVLAGPGMNFLLAILVLTGMLAIIPMWRSTPQIDQVAADRPAARAGLLPGDMVLSVDGAPVKSGEDVIHLIGRAQSASITLLVRRGEAEQVFTLVPAYDEQAQGFKIGIVLAAQQGRLALPQAVGQAFVQSGEAVRMLYAALRDLVLKGQGADGMAGPVGTINLIQQQTRENGLSMYLWLAVVISINLGFMNMLPIPGLDGSRLIFFLVEAVRRKPVNRRVEGMIHFAGFVLLIGLMLVFTYQDIARLIAG